MGVTLDISDQLADLLRTLAAQQGVSVEELGNQALVVGLQTLARDTPDVTDIDIAQAKNRAHTRVLMPSPTIVRGSLRPLQVTLEPDPEASTNAH